MKSFELASGHKITGKVVHEGPKGVVLGEHYREVFTKDANGRLEKHSHGYRGDGWNAYFRAVCGEFSFQK